MTKQPRRICGRLTVALPERAGRCPRCYLYWRRHGVERGAAPPRPCAACRRLASKLTAGRCTLCYRYWLRHGRERPPTRWPRGEG